MTAAKFAISDKIKTLKGYCIDLLIKLSVGMNFLLLKECLKRLKVTCILTAEYKRDLRYVRKELSHPVGWLMRYCY